MFELLIRITMKNKIFIIFSLLSLILTARITAQEQCPPCVGKCCNPPCENPPPPPAPPFSGPEVIRSYDPNDLVPPTSECKQGWARREQPLTYTIRYENDPKNATAAAQNVVIYYPIPPKVDINQIRMGDFGFGDFYFTPPQNTPPQYTAVLNTKSSVKVNVKVEFGVEQAFNRLFWKFTSLDTLTGLPTTDPVAGFLPVNDTLMHKGEGFVTYTIQSTNNAITFDTLVSIADIYFDNNDPIKTPKSVITIDADAPISTITAASYNPDSSKLYLNWAGTDKGCGLKMYTVFLAQGTEDYKPIFVGVMDKTGSIPLPNPIFPIRIIVAATDSVGNTEMQFDPDTVITQFSINRFQIPLKQGWNTISSYVKPTNAEMLNVLSAISPTIALLKDGKGKTTIPSLNLNQVGNWDVLQGYQLKATRDTILVINGNSVPPSTVIPIVKGWQIIPYLKVAPSTVAASIGSLANRVLILKDNAGRVYIPSLGINNIDSLRPAQGYWLKADIDTSLKYTAVMRYESEKIRVPTYRSLRSAQHFEYGYANTGVNATLVLPQETLSEQLEIGDEIGVFTSTGTLCGVGVYNDAHLAITIWSDDIASVTTKEGLLPREKYTLKVWHKQTNEELPTKFSLKEGRPFFEMNGIYILSDIQIGDKLGMR